MVLCALLTFALAGNGSIANSADNQASLQVLTRKAGIRPP